MKTILLFGAGKSTTFLIEYLGTCCEENNWRLLVCDFNLSLAESKTKNFPSTQAISFDIRDEAKRREVISNSDVVISMLPPGMHFLVAMDCITFAKHLLTASYVDEKIKSLKEDIKKKGLIFICEMGLDPGIDHISAMQIINGIKKQGGKINSFKSYCGGLVSPESDDNPWHYKITWNPANVVTAGNAGALYREDGRTIEVRYADIFKNKNNMADVPGLCSLAWYANRDSLSYIDTYHLHDTTTFLRATLRYPAFCRGWEKFIQLDLANRNDEEEIKGCNTLKDWFNLKKEKFFSQHKIDFDKNIFFNPEFSEQINYLGLNEEENLSVKDINSALLLQHLLEKKLAMQPHDRDMIVMLHEVEYCVNGKNKAIKSCLIVKGEGQTHTAMAKTVGLPLAIAAKLILQNKIKLSGLHIPVIPEIYEPVLKELELNGIQFNEAEREL